MNEIFLKKDGTLSSEGKPVEKRPLIFLGCKVMLDDAYTLRSCFQMLGRYDLLAELNPFCQGLMGQYRSAPESGCGFEGIDWIEFGKTVEMIGFPGSPKLEIYSTVIGKNSEGTFEIKSFALDTLLDVNVRIGKLKHVMFGDKVDTFEFDTAITLFEFIDGIMWELSFHNLPKACRISF